MGHAFEYMRVRKLQQSDVTAYARVRNAALRLFADRGASASSIRAVAKAAGVSPGLVQHHFRTKADLQTALEAYVVEKVAELARVSLTESTRPGKLIIGRQIVEFIRKNPDIIRYARRVILEDDPLGRRLFDQIVAAGRILMERLAKQGFLRADIDMAWASLNAMLMVIGPVLLEPGIDRHLDRPFLSDEGLSRWDVAVDDMLTRGIYRDQTQIVPNLSRPKRRGRTLRVAKPKRGNLP